MAQITRVTSEALQATIRRLLPSQQGFGEDLEASNVITPIIDLTPSAEGSALPLELSSAHNFNNTAFQVNATSTVVFSTAGFCSLVGSLYVGYGGTLSSSVVQIEDSSGAVKSIWGFKTTDAVSGTHTIFLDIKLNLFLASGESLRIVAGTDATLFGSVRQTADTSGNIINPVGYNPQ